MEEAASTELPRAEVRTPGPWVTIALIAVNAAAFVVTGVLGVGWFSSDADKLVAVGGSLPALTLSGEPWRLLTAMFLHAGVLHVAMNMFALYSGGLAAERIFGKRAYLAIYMCTGLVGGIATLTKTAMIVSVGASGAVFGVFGALFGYMIAHRAQLDPEVRDRQMKSMGTFVGLNLLIGLTVPAISLAAHVGGFVAGFVIAYLAERGLDIADPKAASARRFPRVMLGSVLSLALVGAGLLFLPKSSVAYVTNAEAKQVTELQAKFTKFITTEKELLASQNDAAEKATKGDITYVEQARILREELVPSWRWIANDIGSVKGLPPVIEARQRAVLEYIATRVAHLEAAAAFLSLDGEDPAAAVALTTMTAKEGEVAASLEKLKAAFAAP